MLTEEECVAALPQHGFFRDFVRYSYDATDAHVGYHIATAITALTQVAPVDLFFPFGDKKVRANFFSLIVGPSSASRKSTAISIVTKLIAEAGQHPMQDPASREALIAEMVEKNRNLIVYSEFGEFLAASEQGPKMPMKTMFNQCYDCDPIGHMTVADKRAKKTAAMIGVQHPRLTIIGGTDPDYLSRHTEMVDWRSGFFSRFFIIYARRNRFIANPTPNMQLRTNVVDQYMEMRTKAANFNREARCRGFSKTAHKLWKSWADTILERADRARFPGPIVRAQECAMRIALLLSLDCGYALSGSDFEIGEAELLPAIAMAELHMKSVLELSEYIAIDADMMERGTVLRAISEAGSIETHTLLTKSQMGKKRFDSAMQTLLAERIITLRRNEYDDEVWQLSEEYKDKLAQREQMKRAPVGQEHLNPPRLFPLDGDGSDAIPPPLVGPNAKADKPSRKPTLPGGVDPDLYW